MTVGGSRLGQLSHLIDITKREKAGIGTNPCSMEFQLDDTAKTDSEGLLTCLTHGGLPLFMDRVRELPLFYGRNAGGTT